MEGGTLRGATVAPSRSPPDNLAAGHERSRPFCSQEPGYAPAYVYGQHHMDATRRGRARLVAARSEHL